MPAKKQIAPFLQQKIILEVPLETAGTRVLKPGPCTSRHKIRQLPKHPPKDLQVEKFRWMSAGSFGSWRICWRLVQGPGFKIRVPAVSSGPPALKSKILISDSWGNPTIFLRKSGIENRHCEFLQKRSSSRSVQWYLANKHQRPPWTLQQDFA